MVMNYRFAISVNPSSNWVEHPILWSALVGNPSQKKTPCLKIGKGIIDEYNQKLQNDYEKRMETYKNEYAEYKLSIEVYKTALKRVTQQVNRRKNQRSRLNRIWQFKMLR